MFYLYYCIQTFFCFLCETYVFWQFYKYHFIKKNNRILPLNKNNMFKNKNVKKKFKLGSM